MDESTRAPQPVEPPRSAIWAEDLSIMFGISGAVLTVGTLLGLGWLAFWGTGITSDVTVLLMLGMDLALVLLAVAFHHLSIELARPLEPTPELTRSGAASTR